MSINIYIPGLVPSSDIGLRVYYLNNIIQQWSGVGFQDTYSFKDTTNNILAQMCSLLITDLDSQEAKNLYDDNIDIIELYKGNAYEEWKASIRDIYTPPPKFTPQPS